MTEKKGLTELLPEVYDLHLNDDDRLEAKIQKSIMDYLKKIPLANFAKIAQGSFSIGGISDIIGCYRGRFVAIEVKRRHGKPTELQKMYLNKNVKAGGYSCIARSVDDVSMIVAIVTRDAVE